MIDKNGLDIRGSRFPILSGEIQFFRMDPDTWEAALDALVEAGITMVATYLGWRHFSTGVDTYDLDGRTDSRLDVRRFFSMCRSRNLLVTCKPGPWICAEDTNGGYPDWLVENTDLQVLDAQARPLMGYMPPFDSPIPSYLHPTYLSHVKIWFEEVDRIIQEFAYPDGPIVLVQLDNEPCYTFHDGLFESDYNASVVGRNGYYIGWLKEVYSRIETLNESYGSRHESFDSVQPPRTLSIETWKDVRRIMDWVNVKEMLPARHIAVLRDLHAANGLSGPAYSVNYNDHHQLSVPNDWHQLEKSADIGGFDYYPGMPMGKPELTMVARSVAYSRVVNRIPWSPEIMSGVWNFPRQEGRETEIEPSEFEYLYLCCLAFGLKGMNFYMFADRDNWIGSPVAANGLRRPVYETVKRVVGIINRIPSFCELDRAQEVGVLYYRPYARASFVSDGNEASVNGHRLSAPYEGFERLFELLFWSNVDPAIIDPWVSSDALEGIRDLFVATGPYMDKTTQELLAHFLSNGGRLHISGPIPSMDLSFLPCALLADALLLRGPRIDDPNTLDVEHAVAAAELQTKSPPQPREVVTFLHRHAELNVLFAVNNNSSESTAFFRTQTDRVSALDFGSQPMDLAHGMMQVTIPPRSVRIVAWSSM